MKKYLLFFSLLNLCLQCFSQFSISDNKRYLLKNGKPFFWLGDTGWELFHRLNREEATRYLANRSQKGFTVIQASILAQLGGLTVPNAYGDLPLLDNNPAKPNEAYFRHVDFIVNQAEELGLFVGLLPTWGTYWASGRSIFTVENARGYGRFLGKRYKDKAIIWILGGDRSVTNAGERAVLDAEPCEPGVRSRVAGRALGVELDGAQQADAPHLGHARQLEEGVLDNPRAAAHQPKIFLTASSTEYWQRSLALVHTTVDGAQSRVNRAAPAAEP